jgi:glutamine---fructose-6-phosphate transaminase (isomerizing)
MCGIVGYIGHKQAQSILLDSLAKLEYRGYDSCGIALANHGTKVFKDAVRVEGLARNLPKINATAGIGHTRWATHGVPCMINAHPHCDCTKKVAVVHNGVISNYVALRKQLASEGHKIVSETDTEVLPHLIEKYYYSKEESGRMPNLEKAVDAALKEVEGSYAIIAMIEGESKLVFARKDSPLIIGIGDREYFLASDVPAILEYTDRVIYLEDGDFGWMTPNNIEIYHGQQKVMREEQKISWPAELAQKGGYEHFMLKEIHEQPRIIRETLSEYLTGKKFPVDITELNGGTKSALLLACGTSFNAGLVGKYIAERLMQATFRVEMASEYNYYYNSQCCPITIGITQSGETADTLKAMRRAKEARSKVIAITNVVGSTASKVADYTLYTRAGPEISVAATKSFTAQLIALYWLAITNARLETGSKNEMEKDFRQLSDIIKQIFDIENTIAKHAAKLAKYNNIFFIGRGANYPIAMEGALKLKEISYIHSEAYAAGEIKHGPFALLCEETPVIAIIAHDSSHEAMLTSIKEIKARGSPVLAIVEDSDEAAVGLADYLIPVPAFNELFSPFINTVVVQLLAYFTARERHCPIDFPRNLAKSVTVE